MLYTVGCVTQMCLWCRGISVLSCVLCWCVLSLCCGLCCVPEWLYSVAYVTGVVEASLCCVLCWCVLSFLLRSGMTVQCCACDCGVVEASLCCSSVWVVYVVKSCFLVLLWYIGSVCVGVALWALCLQVVLSCGMSMQCCVNFCGVAEVILCFVLRVECFISSELRQFCECSCVDMQCCVLYCSVVEVMLCSVLRVEGFISRKMFFCVCVCVLLC